MNGTKFDWKSLRETLVSEKAKSMMPAVQLPVLPKALLEFNQRAQDPNADIGELSQIISTDSGLSSGLLKRANSAQVGSRSPVTSVKQALVLFGVQATRLRLTALGVQEVMKSSSSQLVNFQNFWNTNLERALFARELAKLLKVDSDLAYTASMLQDFLLPVLSNKCVDDYLEYAEAPQQFASLMDFEQQRFGWNHAIAAGNVMLAWQFPDELICCVCLHHLGASVLQHDEYKNTTLAAVAIASLLPDALQQETKSMQRLLEVEQQWKSLELMPIAEKIDAEFRSIAQNVQNHFSFLHHLQRELSRAG